MTPTNYYRVVFDTAPCPFRPFGVIVTAVYAEYKVLKKTQHGAWIDVWGVKQFVRDGEGKRYAHTTKEAALKYAIARKQSALKHASARVNMAHAELVALNEGITITRPGCFNFITP